MRGRALLAALLLTGCSTRVQGPEGFATVQARVADNPMCLWLADTTAKQERGLMDVTSLGHAKGMVFRFAAPTRVAFYMYRTLLPLTVVFLDATSSILESVDMVPCPEEDPAACPRYRPESEYVQAIEVPQGKAAGLGLTVGARMAFGNNC